MEKENNTPISGRLYYKTDLVLPKVTPAHLERARRVFGSVEHLLERKPGRSALEQRVPEYLTEPTGPKPGVLYINGSVIQKEENSGGK